MTPSHRSAAPRWRRVATAGVFTCALLHAAPGKAADLVLTGARVYTVNPAQPWASELAVEDGRIVYVGEDASAFVDPGTRVVDLDGRMILPGFQDAHAHPASGGVKYTECPVFDLPGINAVLEGIRRCVQQNPEATLIRGAGWSMDQFEAGQLPAKQMLDAIDATRALVFSDSDGHAMWLNSAALRRFNITAETPDPEGGVIARVTGTQTPSGSILEEAMNLVMAQWPAYTDEEIEAGLRWAQDHYLALGVTAVQDAYVELEGNSYYRSLPAWAALAESGDLKLRASLSLAWRAADGGQQLETMKQLRARHSGERLRVDTIKFWADGVIETRTAMLLEPYTDQPDWHGLMMIPRQDLMKHVPLIDAAGFQAHIHAIGDATVRYALDAIEAAWARNGRRDARHHINHLQFVHPDDIGRFRALDVGASFEPYWFYYDGYIRKLTIPRVGPERMRNAYPVRSILDTGARVAFSSDWSVSSADPLLGIETAVTHTDPHSNEGEVFLPEQRLSLDEAIAAYTIRAAELNFLDQQTGSIEPGKLADIIILDKDLFAIPPGAISDSRVTATLIDGEVVYGALE